jgi:hypothetical protein
VNIELLLSCALADGLSSLRDSSAPIFPYIMIYADSDSDPRMRFLEVRRFVGEDLGSLVAQAHESVIRRPGWPMYAIGWDGSVTVDGRKWDALLVEVGDRDHPEARIMAQRCELATAGRVRRSHQHLPVGAPILARTADLQALDRARRVTILRSPVLRRLCGSPGISAARVGGSSGLGVRSAGTRCGGPGVGSGQSPRPGQAVRERSW